MIQKAKKILEFIIKFIRITNLHKLPLLFFIITTLFLYVHKTIGTTELSEITPDGFEKQIFYEGNQIDQGNPYYQSLLQEKIIRVERHCQSLFGIIPSGILTPFSWIIAGVTIRHEFILYETTNNFVIVELGQSSGEGNIQIKFWGKSNRVRMESVRNQILNGRYWRRTQNMAEGRDIGQLEFQQIDEFLKLITICWCGLKMFRRGKYDVLFKNCKSLARSLFYFSLRETPVENVAQNILGLQSELWFDVCDRSEIQCLLKIIYNKSRSISQIEDMIGQIKKIRKDRPTQEQQLQWNSCE